MRGVMKKQVNDQDSIKTDNEKEEDGFISSSDVEINNADISPKCWIEVLPSKIGVLLIAVIANIMTEDLSSTQQNILGNFVAALGASILYKASRDESDKN